MYVVQGAWASLLLYIRWEIRTDSKVPLGFASNANETTVGIKQNAQNSLHWYCNMATKHLQLLVSNAKLHLNDHLDDEFPPSPSHRQTQSIWQYWYGSPWHRLCQPAPRWPNSASCRQDSALGAVGRLCPYLLRTSWPQKTKAGFAKDIPNHSPHLSSPISKQLAGIAAGWANSWFWNPQDFPTKVPWLWQASLSAPLPAFI